MCYFVVLVSLFCLLSCCLVGNKSCFVEGLALKSDRWLAGLFVTDQGERLRSVLYLFCFLCDDLRCCLRSWFTCFCTRCKGLWVLQLFGDYGGVLHHGWARGEEGNWNGDKRRRIPGHVDSSLCNILSASLYLYLGTSSRLFSFVK